MRDNEAGADRTPPLRAPPAALAAPTAVRSCVLLTSAPKQCHLDLTAREPPEYSFGGRNLQDRSSFIHGSIKNGALYSARPATSSPHANVGPAQYAVRAAITEPASPRPVWAKADRFATQDKLFISKRHVRAKLGLNSPGPKYSPTNYDIATNLKQQGKPANVPAGKWCP